MSTPLLASLCLGTSLNASNSTLIATALVPISADLDVAASSTALLVSVMYLASAVGQPVAGHLADLFGPRRVFLGGASLVIVAGTVGALASSLTGLVVARIVVGLGTGAIYPAAISLVRERSQASSRPDDDARSLSLLNASSMVMLTAGPPLGGVLVDTVGWRAVFAVNVPLGLVTLVLGLLLVPPPLPRRRGAGVWASLDLPGTVLFGISVSVLMSWLLTMPRPSWSLLAVLTLALTAFVWHELGARTPFIDVRMLRHNLDLVLTYLRVLLTFVVVYGVIFGVTPWLQVGRDLSATAAGTMMLSMSALGTAATLVAHRLPPTRALILAAICFVSAAGSLSLVGDDTSLVLIVCVLVLFGLPNGLAQVANQVVVYRAAPRSGIGTAAGLYRTSQYIGAMIAASTIGVVYATEVTLAGMRGLALLFLVLTTFLAIVTMAARATSAN